MFFLLFLIWPFGDQQPHHCDVFGSVLEVYSADKADIVVFEEESEAFADLVVYDQDNHLRASRSGFWHFVNKEVRAQYRVFFTKNRDMADFSVFFTDTESFAGCR